MTDSVNPFATINATNIPQNLLSYNGKLGALYGISIKNFFLTIITLGIYSSWAINNIRKYTFNSLSIGAERLEYSGKGGQLFKGALIIGVTYFVLAFSLNILVSNVFPTEYAELENFKGRKEIQEKGLLVPPLPPISKPQTAIEPEVQAVLLPNGEFDINGCLAKYAAEDCERLYILNDIRLSNPVVVAEKPSMPQEPKLSTTAQALGAIQLVLAVLALLTFSYFAKFSAARERLTHAKWRGISGGIIGVSILGYIALRLKRLILNIISLGYLNGRSDLIAEEYILSNSYIGKTNFRFTPDFTKLDKINLITLLLAIPTLGASRIWYHAAFINYRYQCLSLSGIKFESGFSGGKLLWLYISNLLIIIFTLLIGSPIARHRSLKFLAENLRVMGNADNLDFIQQASQSDTLGEGVNQVFGTREAATDLGVI